jgi:hypothetical protein
MSFSSQFTARGKELKEEASRLHKISKELRLKSIELRFYNRLYSNMGRFTTRQTATDLPTVVPSRTKA